ncbi:MAG: hypothetical protein H7Y60_15160 [Rhodospirillaceae bacterium]|nr:hypothetical protein [Rhodospirillales bacterium]
MSQRLSLVVLAAALLAVAPSAIAQQSESLGEQAARQLLQGQSGANQEEQTVRQVLQDQGYTGVGKVQRVYRTTATRDGRQVAVTVDPESGQIKTDSGKRQTTASEDRRSRSGALNSANDVRDLLNDQGCSRVSNIRRQGNEILADAERDGQQMSLAIDSQTGQIQELN